MNRSGYTEDFEDQWRLICWRGAVAKAIRGNRGQQLLRELRDALDAMPEKRLIVNDLVDEDGEHCTLGVLGAKRGLPLAEIDPEEYDQVAAAFGVAPALVREIEYENDGCPSWTPERRWEYMRKWVDRHIVEEAQPA